MRPVPGRGHAPRVVAVITAFRAREYIARAMHSLVAQDYPNLRRVVIDDCSPDGTYEVAREAAGSAGEQVEVLRNPSNLGFSVSLNRALDLCGEGDFLFIHQDDVEIVEADYISRLMGHFDDEDVALVSGQAADFERLPTVHRIFARLLNLDYAQEGTSEIAYSLLKADLVRAAPVKRTGGFGYALNPRLGLEDQLLARRLRMSGYRVLKDSTAHYKVDFARSESAWDFLTREFDAGQLLGYAVASGLLVATPPQSQESYARWFRRLTEVTTGSLVLASGMAVLITPAVGLGAMMAILAIRALWYARIGRDFRGPGKLWLVIVGILDDLWTTPGFYLGVIKGVTARWGSQPRGS